MVSSGEPKWRSYLRWIASDRLLQFTVIGGLIFLYTPPPRTSRNIDITASDIAALVRADRTRVADQPLVQRAERVTNRQIEDELLYREGLRLGLDMNDGIIRQRVIQRTLFLAEELGGASKPPTDEELQAWFEEHKDEYPTAGRVVFRNVFAHSPEELGPPPPSDQPVGGLVSPVGPQMAGKLDRVAKALGSNFVDALSRLEPGQWSEPIESTRGWHRVYVVEWQDERASSFAEVEKKMEVDRDRALRREAVANFLQQAFERYRVSVAGQRLTSLPPSDRTATRTFASAED